MCSNRIEPANVTEAQKNFEIMVFGIIFVSIYVLSFFGLGVIYIDSIIDITFWSLCVLFLPGVNTVVLVILLFKKYGTKKINEFFSFKRFLSDINDI